MEGKNRTGETPASRKLGLSCAECRRSKLKCDRSFPCQSCIRRGCAGICPEGTLAATKGNKVLMAHAQRLSQQVENLKERVQELEGALAGVHGNNHPLLSSATAASSVAEPDSDISDAIGSLSIGIYGQSKYHGESASSEYFQDLLTASDDEDSTTSNYSGLDLPLEIVDLVNAFPFGMKDCPYSKNILLEYLPSQERALELSQRYYAKFSWMYDPVPSADFNDTILNPIYGNGSMPRLDDLHSHKISVFFILLANGLLADSHPASATLARRYHALSRAAMSLDSITSEATCATIQSLFLVFRYLYTSDRFGTEERWLLTGISARLAQTLGLQRDGSNWNLSPEDIQRRRRVFWELFVWESWGSLVNGRPSSLSIRQTDCLFPEDLEAHVKSNGEVELGWNCWKYRYAAVCVSASSFFVFSPKSPPYDDLLELDKKIRNYPAPEHLVVVPNNEGAGRSWSTDPRLAGQQLAAFCIKETNLLYIHRSYFGQAIRQLPKNPLQHRYAPSVLVAYQSACRIINALRGVYSLHPHVSSVTWYFWASTFSACIVLGALVVESPACALAADALRELEDAVPFYQEGSRNCGAAASVAALEKLRKRAVAAFAAFEGGGEAARPDSADVDDLEVLSGRRTVIAKASRDSTLPCTSNTSRPQQDVVVSSQVDTADILIDFFKGAEQPAPDVQALHDFDMGETQDFGADGSFRPPADEEPSYSRHRDSPDTYMNQFMPPGIVASSAHQSNTTPTSIRRIMATGQPGAWQIPYLNPDMQHAIPQRTHPPLYNNNNLLNDEQTPHYQQSPPVWRNFGQDFGPI